MTKRGTGNDAGTVACPGAGPNAGAGPDTGPGPVTGPDASANTVRAVLAWAVEGCGRPPAGGFGTGRALARPDPAITALLATLGAVTSARLRLGSPPLADPRPLPGDTLLLALAIGVADHGTLALALIAALPPVTTPAEAAVRHGLVGAALPYLPADLCDPLRACSPWTAVFERPAPGDQPAALAAADILFRHPVGRPALCQALAAPVTDPAVRRWRCDLVDRLRLAADDDTRAGPATAVGAGGRSPGGEHAVDAGSRFVFDLFEAVVTWHLAAALGQSRTAAAVVRDPAAGDDALSDALTVGRWWGLLDTVERSHPAEARRRFYLGRDYREAIAFSRQIARQTGGRA